VSDTADSDLNLDAYRIGGSFTGLSRPSAFALVAGCYLLASLAGLAVIALLPGQHPIAVLLWADLAATIVIFGLSMLLGNSSLYDPYWSVAPPLIVSGWWLLSAEPISLRRLAVLLLIVVWAARLTGNWARGWQGLRHEDWRYVQIRARTRGRLPWWLVSFTGIQLMPTLVVFAGLLSVWPALTGDRSFGLLDVLAIVVTWTAISIEASADRQLRRFAADPANKGYFADGGLWRWSRHPNYFGEIMFWWGLWLFGLAAAPSWWWTVIGPLAMVALFLGVSIPLMERRSLERRRGYAAHQRRSRVLLPLPRPLFAPVSRRND
jgi:steroid 5-alpha reductase family enzyme